MKAIYKYGYKDKFKYLYFDEDRVGKITPKLRRAFAVELGKKWGLSEKTTDHIIITKVKPSTEQFKSFIERLRDKGQL